MRSHVVLTAATLLHLCTLQLLTTGSASYSCSNVEDCNYKGCNDVACSSSSSFCKNGVLDHYCVSFIPLLLLACDGWLVAAQRCVRCCCEFRSVYTISAYKEAAHVSSVSNKAVCVCVCAGGKISRLAGIHLWTFLA